MSQALTKYSAQPMGVAEWAAMKEQASMLVKTGFLPPSIKTAEQAIAIALTGRELGIGMMEAIRGINVIQGKPSVSPQLMLALARRTGELERFSVHAPGNPGKPSDATGAECRIKRRNEPEHVTVFGPNEAKALGLAGKDNYNKQPGVMYQWRAVAANLRVTFPDAISGLYTPEEMGANVTVNAEGEMQVADEAPKPFEPSVPMPKEKAIDAQLVEETKTNPEGITDAQRAKLFKFAERAYGPTYKEGLKGYLKTKFNVDSTKDLDPMQFSEAIDWLDELAKTTNPNAPIPG